MAMNGGSFIFAMLSKLFTGIRVSMRENKRSGAVPVPARGSLLSPLEGCLLTEFAQ
jgi:hypothetical protein